MLLLPNLRSTVDGPLTCISCTCAITQTSCWSCWRANSNWMDPTTMPLCLGTEQIWMQCNKLQHSTERNNYQIKSIFHRWANLNGYPSISVQGASQCPPKCSCVLAFAFTSKVWNSGCSKLLDDREFLVGWARRRFGQWLCRGSIGSVLKIRAQFFS